MKKILFLLTMAVCVVGCNKNNVAKNEEVTIQENESNLIDNTSVVGDKTFEINQDVVLLNPKMSNEQREDVLKALGDNESGKENQQFTVVKLKSPMSTKKLGEASSGDQSKVQRIYKSNSGKTVSADFLIVKFPKDIDKENAIKVIEDNGGIMLDSGVIKLRQYHVATKKVGGDIMKLGQALEQTKLFEYVEPNIILLPNFDE